MVTHTEIRYEKATVRIHGKPDPDKLHTATAKFIKKAIEQRKKKSGGTKNAY